MGPVMMKHEALKLAQQGFPVIPLHWPRLIRNHYECSCGNPQCSSVGKHPLTVHGVTDASTDAGAVLSWWDQWPDANIGIATGYLADVIDLDGPEALESFSVLCAQYGDPQTLAYVQTGRAGGWHLYTNGTGAPNWTGGRGGWPEGLDGKGKGGYVVAPPSLHETGNRYQWTEHPFTADTPGTVPWPQWFDTVHAALNPPMRTEPVPWNYSGNGNGQHSYQHSSTEELIIEQPYLSARQRFAETVLARITSTVLAAGPGSRWQSLVIDGIWPAAGLIHGREITRDDAVTVLTDVARHIGLDSREVNRIPGEMDRALARRTFPIMSRLNRPGESHAQALAAGTVPPGDQDGGQAVHGSLSAVFVDPLSDEAELDRLTRVKKLNYLASDAAKREITHDRAGKREYVAAVSLADLVAEPPEPVLFRIDGVWPAGGRVMCSAQYKAGKTTLIGNLVRSLADCTHFLGKFPVYPITGKIALLDFEMNRDMLRGWLNAQGIENQHKVYVYPMRGKSSDFDVTDERVRAHWVQEFQDNDIQLVIVDCLGPVLAGAGIDESSGRDMAEFISAYETLLADAGISETLIVHHMGHTGERARGASRMRDWPDVEFHLIREGQEDEHTDTPPDAPRYFRAYGRDVSIPETLLDYEPNMRWLTIGPQTGNRKQVKTQRLEERVEQYVKDNPGQTGRMIRELCTGNSNYIVKALKTLVAAGTLVSVERKKDRANAVFYYHHEYQEVTEPEVARGCGPETLPGLEHDGDS